MSDEEFKSGDAVHEYRGRKYKILRNQYSGKYYAQIKGWLFWHYLNEYAYDDAYRREFKTCGDALKKIKEEIDYKVDNVLVEVTDIPWEILKTDERKTKKNS